MATVSDDPVMPPVPVVKLREGIDAAMGEVGRRYWRFDGFDSETGRPCWTENASKIDCSPWGSGKAYVVAAAAVRAVLPDRSCPQCDGELTLTSRSSLEKIALGGQPGRCADCDVSLQEQVARVLNPQQLRKARERHDREASYRREQHLRQEWEGQRRAIVRDRYDVDLLPSHPVPAAPVRVELTALALLRYAPSPAPLGPVQEWIDPLHPSADKDHHCVTEVLHAGLIKIHPDSRSDSFVWEPATFDQAVAQADGEGQVPIPTLTGRYSPLHATHYTPYGHSLETAAAAVRDHLAARLNPTAMTVARHQELIDTVVEVLAEETIRYFEYLLREHHLPEVPDNHKDKLVEAAYAIARVRPLSELYNLAWRSARDAATAAQRNPQAPRANMTTHGVNRFESNVQWALNPAINIKPYRQVADLELAAMTRTLFLRVLQQDPFKTSVPAIEAAFPTPAASDLDPDELPSDFDQLTCTECGLPVEQRDAWLWVEVREALDYVEDTRRALESADLPRALFDLTPARWRLGHTACGSDSGAVCEARLPTTYRGLLAWTATILRERSKWIHGSDFADLLNEAAQRTGRFGDTRKR